MVNSTSSLSCCACAGICCHTGPHQYCDMHSNGSQRESVNIPNSGGWVCPRCGTVWAWWVAQCTCKPLVPLTKDSGIFDIVGLADKADVEEYFDVEHDVWAQMPPNATYTIQAHIDYKEKAKP